MRLGEGGAQPNISRGKIIGSLIPIPSIEEQQRILKKVDRIMKLIGA